MVASETAIRAGWAFSVSCKVSAGPSQIVVASFSPSAASTSSNTARATGKVSANAFPMPTAWEPCPGKVNAAVIDTPEQLTARLPTARATPNFLFYFNVLYQDLTQSRSAYPTARPIRAESHRSHRLGQAAHRFRPPPGP